MRPIICVTPTENRTRFLETVALPSFLGQTYRNKIWVICDTSETPSAVMMDITNKKSPNYNEDIYYYHFSSRYDAINYRFNSNSYVFSAESIINHREIKKLKQKYDVAHPNRDASESFFPGYLMHSIEKVSIGEKRNFCISNALKICSVRFPGFLPVISSKDDDDFYRFSYLEKVSEIFSSSEVLYYRPSSFLVFDVGSRSLWRTNDLDRNCRYAVRLAGDGSSLVSYDKILLSRKNRALGSTLTSSGFCHSFSAKVYKDVIESNNLGYWPTFKFEDIDFIIDSNVEQNLESASDRHINDEPEVVRTVNYNGINPNASSTTVLPLIHLGLNYPEIEHFYNNYFARQD